MFDRKQSVLEVMTADTTGLAALTDALQSGPLPGAIDRALDLVDAMEGRLIVAGVGKSGLVGRKLAATFSSTGTPAYFVHAAEASHGDLGMIAGNDVVLLLSWSGETRELSDILAYARRFGVPVISITGVAESSLAKSSDVALVLPKVPEACPHNLAPTTSTLLQMALGDALAITILKERGFTEESFRDFHPGGKLGAALTPVSDIMFQGERMPLVTKDTPVIEVLGEISNKSLGICGVLGADGGLSGVITDGDVRRYLESRSDGSMKDALWNAKADSLMTPGSVHLEPGRLSARALHVLQSNKISAAFVLEDGKPVGVVTLIQLLTLGVA
ncbi:MAG: KpsF/GutQ family sugar-phosphate isomerase [Pseudomonadota bacterium]